MNSIITVLYIMLSATYFWLWKKDESGAGRLYITCSLMWFACAIANANL